MRMIVAAIAAASLAPAANAVTVAWADWQSFTTTTVAGQITSGSTTLGVNFATSGEAINFVQLGNFGETFYYTEGTPAPYTGGIVTNAPPTSDLISLDAGGTKTITFSQAVTDPYIALVSWNGNTATFTQPFENISEGQGFWGAGTFTLGANNDFVGVGEVHGILRFNGTFTSVTFTDTTEGWHGFTVGIGGVAPPAIPEPSSWALLIAGFGLTGAAMRRRRTAIA